MLLLLVTFAPIVAAILIMIGFPARLTALAASLLTLLVGAIIFLPVFYGLMGLCMGAIVAALYNLLAGFVGGVAVDIE